MAEPQIPQPYVRRVIRTQKERDKIYAEIRERERLALMSAVPLGILPSGIEVLEIPSTTAGQASSIVYKHPATAVTAGTTSLTGRSFRNKYPGESSETLMESLKLEEIRINNNYP